MDFYKTHPGEETAPSEPGQVMEVRLTNATAFKAGLFTTLGIICAVPVLIAVVAASIGFLVALSLRLAVPEG